MLFNKPASKAGPVWTYFYCFFLWLFSGIYLPYPLELFGADIWASGEVVWLISWMTVPPFLFARARMAAIKCRNARQPTAEETARAEWLEREMSKAADAVAENG